MPTSEEVITGEIEKPPSLVIKTRHLPREVAHALRALPSSVSTQGEDDFVHHFYFKFGKQRVIFAHTTRVRLKDQTHLKSFVNAIIKNGFVTAKHVDKYDFDYEAHHWIVNIEKGKVTVRHAR